MDNLFRSLMFVPGHNEKLMNSAIRTDADVLLLDLEDSVQPKENKQKARCTIKHYVIEGLMEGRTLFPRVNDSESGELIKDLRILTIDGVDGFMYPKAKTGSDIYFIDKLLEAIEYEKGYDVGRFKLIPLIETSSAVLHVEEICKASDRVVAVAYGCEDFIADLGGVHDKKGQSLFTPRAMIAMAAKASGVIPIDTVHINVHDLDDLEENIILAKTLGFEGMLVLHPKEIKMVHEYYSPSEDDYLWAQEILKLNEEAEKDGRGVAVINNTFIGPPMVITANKIINKYKKSKL